MPANDAAFTANYELIPELSDEAGITEVQVNGTKGVIAENVINVVLPVGASLTEDPGDIVITLKHEKAKVKILRQQIRVQHGAFP